MRQSSFTDFFVSHPVFAWVVNLIIILLGVVSFYQLQTRQYPVVERSQITVRANYGAAAKVLEEQVTKVLEEAFASLQSLDYMSSEVRKGESTTRLFFDDGRSMDAASADVREILSRLTEKLPDNIRLTVTKGRADAASILDIAVVGPESVPLSELHKVAEHSVKGALESIPGVALAEVFGGSALQMSVSLDPEKLFSYRISVTDVVRSLKESNIQKPAGYLKEENRQFSLTTEATLSTPSEFGRLVIYQNTDSKKDRQSEIRLADLASVSLEEQEEEAKVFFNGLPAVCVVVRPQPNANPIEISKQIQKRLTSLQKTLPHGIELKVASDASIFVRVTISQVYQAIIEAVVLVLFVIFFFLRSFSASLIPLITIPVSLVGTFFVMYLLGFTLNVLSLLALVLAIGLVVDDAIVVLENVYRHIENGEKPYKAALMGCREIRFSVIAMTLTLAAVYAPIALIPGTIGKLFKEFALTLAGAVILSGVIALTLSPPMCARLLRSHEPSTGHSTFQRFSQWIDLFLQRLEDWYVNGVRRAVRRKSIVWVSAALVIFSSVLCYKYGIEEELSPRGDEGTINLLINPPVTRNLNYLSNLGLQIDKVLKKVPEIKSNLLFMQIGDCYGSATLKLWNERTRSCREVNFQLEEGLKRLVGADVFSYCKQSSMFGSSSSDRLEFNLLSNKPAAVINAKGRELRNQLRKMKGIAYLHPSEYVQEPGYNVIIHRDRAAKLGVSAEDIAETIKVMFKGSIVTYFEKENRSYPVIVALPENEKTMEKIQKLFVKSQYHRDGVPWMVSLREIINLEPKGADAIISRFDRKGVFTIQADLEKGTSAKAVYEKFKEMVEETLPSGYELQPAGELRNLYKEGQNIYMIFGLALIFIFLVMAAQFESFLLPLVIMLSVPFALAGGIVFLALGFGTVSIYGQIGLITLIGLITKHGILLVDFAESARKKGQEIVESMIQASRLRLRPILMTTLAMVLGAFPLAFATGSGAEARQQIGWVIVGGMTIGTLFTLFVIPLVYLTFIQLKLKMVKERVN